MANLYCVLIPPSIGVNKNWGKPSTYSQGNRRWNNAMMRKSTNPVSNNVFFFYLHIHLAQSGGMDNWHLEHLCCYFCFLSQKTNESGLPFDQQEFWLFLILHLLYIKPFPCHSDCRFFLTVHLWLRAYHSLTSSFFLILASLCLQYPVTHCCKWHI